MVGTHHLKSLELWRKTASLYEAQAVGEQLTADDKCFIERITVQGKHVILWVGGCEGR